MDEFRYILGLILVVIMPMVITFWLVIHLGAKFWRKQKPIYAYWTAGLFISVVITACILWRDGLIGSDLGLNWPLFILGTVIYLISWRLWLPVKQHLNFRTFAGLPEVTEEKILLISTGPFSLVRHPRYLMVLIGIIGWCLMSNFSGVYLMGVASFIGLWIIIALEERDLIVRFGDQYRQYQQEVPSLLPQWSGLKRLMIGKI